MKIGFEKKEPAACIAGFIFYTALSLELFYVLLYKSAYSIPSEGVLFRITFVLFLCKLMLSKNTTREWIVILLFGVFGVISYFCSGRNEILRLVVMCAAMKDQDLKKVLKYILAVMTAGCLVIVLLSVTDIYGTVAVTAVYRKKEVEATRWVLGMGHPNQLHAMFWSLTTLAMYCFFEKLNVWSLLGILAVNTLLFLKTDSKGGFLAVIVAVCISAVLIYAKKLRDRKWIYYGTIAGIVLMALFTFAVAYYGKLFFESGGWKYAPYFGKINRFDRKFFTNRMFECYAHEKTTIVDFRLFSKPDNQGYMDMGFYKLFFWYGYIPGAVYVLANCLMVLHSLKTKNYALLMFVADWNMYNFLEAHEITKFLACNYLLFLLGGLWSEMLHADHGENVYFWHIFKRVSYTIDS